LLEECSKTNSPEKLYNTYQAIQNAGHKAANVAEWLFFRLQTTASFENYIVTQTRLHVATLDNVLANTLIFYANAGYDNVI